MPSVSVQISNHRSASVASFAFKPTYEGALEGTMERINQIALERIPKQVGNFLGNYSCPIYVRQPSADPLAGMFPRYFFIALLTSEVVKGRPDSDDPYSDGSQLAYCWFTDDVTLPLNELLQNALEPFDWNAIAQNTGF